ncbi:hypothetical protein BJF78_20280 [Pseudonocardia sp. CNS-139]|nr:hypothetical protein BJF78_20280 [Pseudonocardia sp. CNS-139]
MRVRPPVVIGTGLAIAVVTALVPAAFGAPVLGTVPVVVGPVEVQTSLFLEIGVYVLIVGVVLDLLRSLGAGIERDMADAGETDPP